MPGPGVEPESGIDDSGIDGGALPDESFETFEAFYERQYRAVVRLAAALVGRWDVAEELVQDAFIALYPRWDKVARYDAPEAWLRRVVLNRARSSLRRRAVEARVTARLARRRSEVGGSEGARIGEAEVWHLVASLPKRQAQVIALVFLEDRSVAEVARILECGENTVRTHLGRGRRALARRLGTDDDDADGEGGHG